VLVGYADCRTELNVRCPAKLQMPAREVDRVMNYAKVSHETISTDRAYMIPGVLLSMAARKPSSRMSDELKDDQTTSDVEKTVVCKRLVSTITSN